MTYEFFNTYLPLVEEFEKFKPLVEVNSSNENIVGFGRNLNKDGISKEEAQHLLKNDIQKVIALVKNFVFFEELSVNRKMVIIDIVFSMGLDYLVSLKEIIKYLEKKEFEKASEDLKKTLWFEQKGYRAKFFIKKMFYG